MTKHKHFRLEETADQLVWLYLDVADSETNTLSQDVIRELTEFLDTLVSSPPKGLLITSAKQNGFIAGADVKEFTTIRNSDEALTFVQRGQALMDRLDTLTCPTIAVINGFCLGGGLELSLACDFRIALDDPKTRLGLPEIKLGIHPGFGGTVRALRILGALKAMDIMLTGRTLAAKQARKMGVVDHVVPERLLRQAAESLITSKPPMRFADRVSKLANWAPLRPIIAGQLRKKVMASAKPEHYPAPFALIDLWQRYGSHERIMMREEAKSVAKLSITDTARNLVRVFFLQDLLKSTGDKSAFAPAHVHVIGAGVMGGDIAAWCALQGFEVTVQDTNKPGLAKAIARANKTFMKRFRGDVYQVNAAMDRLTTDEKGLGVRRADVIIEAIFEDITAKHDLYKQIEPLLKPDALLATNTSSIKLETLARALDDPGRLVGLHFFNPVAKMPLVEVVKGSRTRKGVVEQALAFARHIDKLPLKVKSSPGFLVNRILMPYLLEAVTLIEEGVSKEVIDRAAKDFGMPMGPIELADTVGLDVCKFVANILAEDLGFLVPGSLNSMVDAGKLGRKSGNGFYRYKGGKAVKQKAEKYKGDINHLQDRLILRLLNESVACLREGVVEDGDALDAGVIFGTGFAPFRGGPLHYLESRGREPTRKILQNLENDHGLRFAADAGW